MNEGTLVQKGTVETSTSSLGWCVPFCTCLCCPVTALLPTTASDEAAKATALSLALYLPTRPRTAPTALHHCPGTTAVIKLSCPTLLHPLLTLGI